MSKKKPVGYYQRQFKIAREAWSKFSPLRRECFNLARVKSDDNLYKWRCALCSNLFALSEVQCDHIEPISKTIPTTKEEYVNLFLKLESDKLQILCKKHHNEKTNREINARLKDTYIQNILSTFPSIFDFQDSLGDVKLSKLKKVSNVIDDYKADNVPIINEKTYSKILNQFLKEFKDNDCE